MSKKFLWLGILCFGLTVKSAPRAMAHGVEASFQSVEAISILARFDSGTPFSNAQVVVYAPNDPQNPYLHGVTDENGKFVFPIDKAITGSWAVKVRSAGHGTIINIPVEATTVNTNNTQEIEATIDINSENSDKSAVTNNSQNSTMSTASSPNASQKILMAVSGVWGFVGTALFFSRKS
ncbi:MAG: carboxypeptidase regulatory-like domain-containing protein [Cyanobacterium sp. T60_A2020_053]|nr:carboxypeptidase regulatory-like domain-containing protein [Cyanobacterium sp. T60_A2020_053]